MKHYTYCDLLTDLETYEMTSIGTTYDNRHIYSMRIGCKDAKKNYLLIGSIHGREYINTYLLISIAKYYTKFISLLNDNNVALHIVPMANPDGVVISQTGYKGLNNYILSHSVSKMLLKHHTFHQKWKSNACGIDLNRNFPSGFHTGGKPGPKFYPGDYPASSRETKALMAYVESFNKPTAIIHYHSKGNLIYWDYSVDDELRTKNYQLAHLASTVMNYKLIYATKDTVANGGFGDWCVYEKKIPSITIENGRFFTPVPSYQFGRIYENNLTFLNQLIRRGI